MGFFFVIGFPLLMALFFGSIFSGDGGAAGSMDIALVDEDRTAGSAAFASALDASDTLQVLAMEPAPAMEKLKKGDLTAVLVLKKGFGDGSGLFFGSEPLIEVTVDPSRKAEREYLRGILIQKAFEGLQKKFQDPGTDARAGQAGTHRDPAIRGDGPGPEENLRRFHDELGYVLRGNGPQGRREGDPFQGARHPVRRLSAGPARPAVVFRVFPSRRP